jgi:DNA-binding transcriptional regulator YiaG
VTDTDLPTESDRRIVDVQVFEAEGDNVGHIRFELADGRAIEVPVTWTWRLEEASPEERKNYELGPVGLRVRWPDIDEDLTASALLQGSPVREPNEVTDSEVAETFWTPGRITRLRKRLDLNQKGFAKKIGVERQATVSDWERGDQTPSGPAMRVMDRIYASLERGQPRGPTLETTDASGGEVKGEGSEEPPYDRNHANVISRL